ncbi:DNA internalization-related competence protein ComEC/Rec2 [Gracilibacillus alcaliphilus]|uniref:DNA internalization-related competence protein ComEC/Rec2 n=1 Tax=Gracilibacillus alcaliphilus TaxID=1401441 RepID=UPI001957EBA4|nr:DNA internalization-related competence protein ComEC/Rec2 [Gracilibacillus alcaliphilus]MBM7678873.1 competence protein ComEC [Gracilibacillus alcaliphilus]
MSQRLHWMVVVYLLCFFGQHIDFRLFVLLGAGLFIYLIRILRLSKLYVLLLLLLSLWFYIHIPAIEIKPPPNHLGETQIEGKITSYVERKEQYIRFILLTNQQKIQVTYFPPEATSYVSQQMFKTGAVCSLKGSYQEIPSARNPGQFNYQAFLASQNIHYQFLLESTTESSCEGQNSLQKLYNLRDQILKHAEQQLSPLTYAWFAAMLFGDRSFMDEETLSLFQDWHLTHLIAISGLHVGLIVSIIYVLLLYLCRITVEKSQLLVMGILVIYPILSGGAPSVWRASLMMIVLLVLHKLSVRLAVSDVISVVFIVLLFFDPYLIYSLAFQFSFIITYAIILSRKIVIAQPSYLWNMFQISFLSMMVILPIQLLHFYQFQPLSVLANLAVIPYFTLFVLPLLFLLLLCFPLPSLLSLLDQIFDQLHSLFLELLSKVDEMFSLIWLIGEFPVLLVGIYYLLLYFFMTGWETHNIRQAFSTGVLIVFLLLAVSLKPYLDPHGYVTILDIGQGDAIVIELPFRKAVIMIDAAGTMEKDFTTPSAKNFEQIIDPFFKARAINRIEAIFLSHADHDHIGSVPFILENYQVDYLFTSFFEEEIIEHYQQINPVTDYLNLHKEDTVVIQDQRFEVLHPYQSNPDKNENSMVLHTILGKQTWLFTGDIGVETEKKLLQMYPSLQADILKLGHHGSDTSSSEPFLRSLEVQAGIISAGVNNRYGHPHDSVVERLDGLNMEVYRTDESGAITFQFGQENGTFFTFLP